MLYNRYMSHSFPKIIWQTHNHMVDELPEHLNKICGTWINLNPGWQHIYVDHIQREAMVAQLAPNLINIYKKVKPMYQADIWRYLITYEHGGLYADMDSVCIKPLDQMLEEIYTSGSIDPEMIVVPRLPNKLGSQDKEYTNNANYLIKKKSHIMKQILDSIMPNQLPDSRGLAKCWCGSDHFIATKGLGNFNTHSTLINFQVIADRHAPDTVLFAFDAASHQSRFKTQFSEHFSTSIDYYGQTMEYNEFVIHNNLKYMYY